MKKDKSLAILFPIVIVLLGVFLVFPLFLGEYDRNMGSIGIAHILNGKYILRFFFSGWNPFWYGGFPNHLIYPLLAPITLALIQKTLPFLSMAQVYRIVVATAYVFIPVGIFFLTRYLSKRNLPALLAALIFALAPSANYFLIPGFAGVGESLNFAPWQLSVITDYGEGPHMIDLAIVPFAIIAYFKLLRKPSFYKFLLTGFLIAVITLINLFSAYALAYFLLGVFLSEILLGGFRQKLGLSLLLIPLIYGLMAFGYDISMVKSLAASGYIHPENVFRLPPITNILLVLVLGTLPVIFVLYEILKNKAKLQVTIILSIWYLIFWAIPYAFYRGFWFGSQPNRYMPELNLVAAIIIAVILTEIYDHMLERFRKWKTLASFIFLSSYLIILVFSSRGFIQNSWQIVSPNSDIKETAEYKIAQWLEENISYEKGERAYLTGSPAFFLNEFADVPQIRGDEDNAQADPWWADVVFQVNKGEDGQLAVGWLSAYNVRYIVVDHGAETPFHDFTSPGKFDFLPILAEIEGFKIYENPEVGKIIQAVDLAKIEKLAPFSHPKKPVLDKEGLMAYLKAAEEPVGVKVDYSYQYRTNPDLAVVKVSNASQTTGILFKSTYDRGWRAKTQNSTRPGRVKTQNLEITKIGPDLMLVKPGAAGDYTLELSYHRPMVEYLGYATTIMTIVILAILVVKKKDFKVGELEGAPPPPDKEDEEMD